MFGARRTSTIQELQKKQRLQPVQCWKQEWVTPKNGLPGSSYKVLKWVKSELKANFSDDEDDITESTKAPVVVDDEDAADPNTTQNENDEGDADDVDENPDTTTSAPTAAKTTPGGADTTAPNGPASESKASIEAIKAIDNLRKSEEKLALPGTSGDAQGGAGTPGFDSDQGSHLRDPLIQSHLQAPLSPPTLGSIATVDVGLSIDTLDGSNLPMMPGASDVYMSPTDHIMPQPALDGPGLDSIVQDVLSADAQGFEGLENAPVGIVQSDGVIEDVAMDFAIGQP